MISAYDKEKPKKEAFPMSKDTETLKHDAEVAQFRFALIAPVIQGLFPDTSATAYYKRVTVPRSPTATKHWKNGSPSTNSVDWMP